MTLWTATALMKKMHMAMTNGEGKPKRQMANPGSPKNDGEWTKMGTKFYLTTFVQYMQHARFKYINTTAAAQQHCIIYITMHTK